MTLNKQILITTILLLASIYFFGVNDIDLWVQDHFYNFDKKQFILLAYDNPYKFYFYDGIKRLLILFVVIFLIVFLIYRKTKIAKAYKQGVMIVVLSAILIPLTVGKIKDNTNMPCPKDEIRYNGYFPRTAVWECYPDDFVYKDIQLKCWPAGHASGGFALLSLFFLFKKKRNKVIALVFALGVGWSMGLYKMIIGDHFLSHTVITMILAWLIVLIIAKSVYRFSKL